MILVDINIGNMRVIVKVRVRMKMPVYKVPRWWTKPYNIIMPVIKPPMVPHGIRIPIVIGIPPGITTPVRIWNKDISIDYFRTDIVIVIFFILIFLCILTPPRHTSWGRVHHRCR